MKKLTILTVLLIPLLSISQVIYVPEDYSTIQSGIDAATRGDTVLVAEGIYNEIINFKGKAITLASYLILDGDETHIDYTIIDGSHTKDPDSNYTVYFVNNEDSTSILTGFTLKYLAGKSAESGLWIGGGVFFDNAFPVLLNNEISGQIKSAETKTTSKTYITWIYMDNYKNQLKGSLYKVNDSSLALIPGVFLKQGETGDQKFILIKGDKIDVIKIRRKEAKVRSVLIGALFGVIVGGTIGWMVGDDPPCDSRDWFCSPVKAEQKAVIGGISMGLLGAGAGLIIGSIKINIPINRNMVTFKKNRRTLKKYSVR